MCVKNNFSCISYYERVIDDENEGNDGLMSKSPLETKLYFLMQHIYDVYHELENTDSFDNIFIDCQLVSASESIEEIRKLARRKSL